MAVLGNRISVSTSTTGTGTMSLGPAQPGFQTFAAGGIADGLPVPYVITDGVNWEIGQGIYSAAGPTLTRGATVQSSSGSVLSLSGAAVVSITARAQEIYAPHPGYITGQYYGTARAGATNLSIAVDVGYASLFYVAIPVSVAALSIRCASGAAGSAKLAIYSNANGRPDQKFFDTSIVISNSTMSAAASGLVLYPGFWWGASLFSSAGPSIAGVSSGDMTRADILGGIAGLSQPVTGVTAAASVTFATGFPTTFGTATPRANVVTPTVDFVAG